MSDYITYSQRFRKPLFNEIMGRSGDPTLIDFDKLKKINGDLNQALIEPAYNSLMRMKRENPQFDFSLGSSTFRTLQKQINDCKVRVCDGHQKARPGNSIHGWGRAIDFLIIFRACNGKTETYPKEKNAIEFFEWLKKNAHRYGWVNYLNEAWHWEYVGEPLGTLKNNPAIVKINNYVARPDNTAVNINKNSEIIKSDIQKKVNNSNYNKNQSSSNSIDETLQRRDNDIPISKTTKNYKKSSGNEQKLKVTSVSDPAIEKDKLTVDKNKYNSYISDAPKDSYEYFSGYFLKED